MRKNRQKTEIIVNYFRKRVNHFSESSQLISEREVNQIRTGRQVLKTRLRKSQPYSGKDITYHAYHVSFQKINKCIKYSIKIFILYNKYYII